MVEVFSLIVNILVNSVVIVPSLWFAGKSLVGKGKARFIDAILIVVIGTVVGVVIGAFSLGFYGSIVQLVLWLMLIKYFFNTGWILSLVISIIAVIIFIFLSFILGLIGFALILFI